MRSVIVFLLVLVFVSTACFSLTANADLLSLYTFDNTADNSVATAPNGSLKNGATYTATGKIGAALSLDGVNDYVDLTTAGFPNVPGASSTPAAGGSLWTGSLSFWVNTKSSANSIGVLGAFNDGSNSGFAVKLNSRHNTDQTNNMNIYVRTDGGKGSYSAYLTTPTDAWRDGNWHQITLAWNFNNPISSSDRTQYYLDGVPLATTQGYNSVSNAQTFSSWGNPVRIGAVGRDVASLDNFFSGMLDDVGVWDSRLSASEAAALFNLASDSTLNYNSADAAILFDIYAGGPGTENTTSDGRRWMYSGSVTGSPGGVINHSGVVLGDSGVGGVQLVPEPSITILLGMAGVAGLIVCAWRKRK